MKVQINAKTAKGWTENAVNTAGDISSTIRRARLFTGVIEWKVASDEKDDSFCQSLAGKIQKEYDAVQALRREIDSKPAGSSIKETLHACLLMLHESPSLLTNP